MPSALKSKTSPPTWVERFEQLCSSHFNVAPEVLLDALMMSPNARGYILGSLSELLLQQELKAKGYQVQRIKEKWVGPKLHHGDLYVSTDGKNWFVIESKGLKSNSERWHKIAEVVFSGDRLDSWFRRKRTGEIRDWWARLPAERKKRILASDAFHKARVLETHFVSGTAGRAGRTIATPLKSEFHIVSLDLFLRTGQHEFIFAASTDLASPEGHPDHLKQNYLIDIMIPGVDTTLTLPQPWTSDFKAVFKTLEDPVSPGDMQIDHRKPGEREAGELEEEEIETLEEDS